MNAIYWRNKEVNLYDAMNIEKEEEFVLIDFDILTFTLLDEMRNFSH